MAGVVNVTPDSFSDGGQHASTEEAVAHGLRLWREGADWLDVGGESTRPGAPPVLALDELTRVLPVLAGLRAACPEAVLSIDTRKASVARAALEAGAHVINDVSGAADPEMAEVMASGTGPIVLMHMRGDPSTMQAHTTYDDLVGEVSDGLLACCRSVLSAGVDPCRIVLDPGLGFGKAPGDNPRLIGATPRLRALGYPVMIGASRKRFVGEIAGVRSPERRVYGSVGAALAAMMLGADVLRVHDVGATIQALSVARACLDGQSVDVAG